MSRLPTTEERPEPNKRQDGLPPWITPNLIRETLRVWSPYYGDRLTERDAIEILLDVGRLFDQLGGEDAEAVSGVGEGL